MEVRSNFRTNVQGIHKILEYHEGKLKGIRKTCQKAKPCQQVKLKLEVVPIRENPRRENQRKTDGSEGQRPPGPQKKGYHQASTTEEESEELREDSDHEGLRPIWKYYGIWKRGSLNRQLEQSSWSTVGFIFEYDGSVGVRWLVQIVIHVYAKGNDMPDRNLETARVEGHGWESVRIPCYRAVPNRGWAVRDKPPSTLGDVKVVEVCHNLELALSGNNGEACQARRAADTCLLRCTERTCCKDNGVSRIGIG